MGFWFAIKNLRQLKEAVPVATEKTGQESENKKSPKNKEEEFSFIPPQDKSTTIDQNISELEHGYIVERRHNVLKQDDEKRGVKGNLVGLCLSGGGIRSATFNLGLIQALFRKKFLKYVDYLSTVSGGGYFGACFTSLLNSTPEEYNDDMWQNKKKDENKNVFPFVLSDKGDDKAAVTWLRYFSNYLTAEGDFIDKYFKPIMVFFRGLVTNTFVIIPYLLLISLTLYFIYLFAGYIHCISSYKSGPDIFVILALIFIIFTVLWIVLNTISVRLINSRSNHKYQIRNINNNTFSGLLVSVIIYAILNLHYYYITSIHQSGFHINVPYLLIGTFLILILLSLLLSKKKSGSKSKNSFIKTFSSLLVLLLPPTVIVYLITLIVYNLLYPAAAFPFKDIFTANNTFLGFSPLESVLILMVLLWFLTDPLLNINDYSLHNFYRDRLSKAYLLRNSPKSLFTSVEHKDVLKLSDLYKDNPIGPYHIINTTLNLKKKMPDKKSGVPNKKKKKYSAEEGIFRTGENFIFSRYWCGSAKTGYLKTKFYEGCDSNIDLATATAISGAAVNVAMADKTVSSFRFLFSLLNIRLGYWAKNPWFLIEISNSDSIIKRVYMYFKWLVAKWVIVKEWINSYGLTHLHINLSDGGHFDNLGAYELLKRRCKYLVVSDAEADPNMSFQALSYLIRIARIDLGIVIDINTSDIKINKDSGLSNSHCTIGTIKYPDNTTGYLLYVKSSLTGDEPEHLNEYRVKNSTFPHQTTADQWFDEQQFEAYRELGYHIGMDAFKPVEEFLPGVIEDDVIKLKHFWYPRSQKIEQFFIKHTKELNEIYKEIKNDPDLEFLDIQFYPQWNKININASVEKWLPAKAVSIRKGFYICNMMIQLMENVYLDLDLESEYMHPDNRGWMNEFRHWSQSNMFRLTWALTSTTYGTRFNSFCEKMFGLLVIGDIRTRELETKEESFESEENIRAQVLIEARQDEINFPSGMKAELLKTLEEKNINPVEFRRINDIMLNRNVKFNKLIRLKFIIRDVLQPVEEKPNSVEFDFAIALLKDEEVVFLRVQNQLRGMGLGRQALKILVRDFHITRFNGDAKDAIAGISPKLGAVEGYKQYMDRFERMIQSVKIEMGIG